MCCWGLNSSDQRQASALSTSLRRWLFCAAMQPATQSPLLLRSLTPESTVLRWLVKERLLPVRRSVPSLRRSSPRKSWERAAWEASGVSGLRPAGSHQAQVNTLVGFLGLPDDRSAICRPKHVIHQMPANGSLILNMAIRKQIVVDSRAWLDSARVADVPHGEEIREFSCYVIGVKLFFAPGRPFYN